MTIESRHLLPTDSPSNPRPASLKHSLPLGDYLKTEFATNDDTIREHSSVAASPSSSLPSSHTSPANLDTSRASPMFVRPPSDAPDSVSVLTRRASPLRSAGYAADIRIWRPSRGQWGCHIPYPDTDAEDSALLDEVAQPPLTPVSPPTAWHRARSLPPPLCSVGHHLHLREYCAWFPASLGRSDCDRLHPPQTRILALPIDGLCPLRRRQTATPSPLRPTLHSGTGWRPRCRGIHQRTPTSGMYDGPCYRLRGCWAVCSTGILSAYGR